MPEIPAPQEAEIRRILSQQMGNTFVIPALWDVYEGGHGPRPIQAKKTIRTYLKNN
jgi:hypothetical protein